MRIARVGAGAILLGAIGLTCAAPEARATPPEIISILPDNGDEGVDPALKELRIEFDQDMGGGRSICGGGPEFPKIAGNPKWETPRALVVPIQLEPSHDYVLSINCQSFQNFRSTGGEPLAPYPVSFRTAADSASAAKSVQASPEKNRAAIGELRKAIDDSYSYRDLRHVDWDAEFKKHAARLEASATPAAFAREAAKLLGAARDVHISVKLGKGLMPTFRPNVEPNCDLQTLSRIVPQWKQRSDVVFSGRFNDGVAYLMIASWPGERSMVLEPALAAIREMKDAPAMIIDVRPNGGGDEDIAGQIASRFATKRVVYSKNCYRSAGGKDGFGREIERLVPVGPDSEHFGGKVAVLMGPANMSSNESFLLMMRAVGAKLVGDRSYGASGNPKPHVLSNGVTVLLPSWKDMLPDGTCLETRGVDPDIPVRTSAGELESADPVLEAGLKSVR